MRGLVEINATYKQNMPWLQGALTVIKLNEAALVALHNVAEAEVICPVIIHPSLLLPLLRHNTNRPLYASSGRVSKSQTYFVM
jgi:hypothetical protein